MSCPWGELVPHFHTWCAFLNWVPSFPVAGHGLDRIFSKALGFLFIPLPFSPSSFSIRRVYLCQNACALFNSQDHAVFLFSLCLEPPSPFFAHTDLLYLSGSMNPFYCIKPPSRPTFQPEPSSSESLMCLLTSSIG